MRRLYVIFLSLVGVLLVGYVGFRSYQVWKNRHLTRLAHEFLAKSDWRNAALSAQGVLRSDPNNLEAALVMAQLADQSRLPTALLWRARVVELDPHSLEDRLALVQTALTLHDYADATTALEGADTEDKKTAAYQNMAGELAVAGNHIDQAQEHFLEACRLEPQNPATQLNLAVVRLHGTNGSDMAEARTVLQRLASNQTNSVLRCQALRELALAAENNKNADVALALSEQLVQEANCAFSDRILRLNVLLETRNADFKPSLAACQREAAANPSEIYELATWELAKTSPGETLAWVRGLPAGTQTNQPTTLMIAECYEAAKDWRGLQTWLENQNWDQLEFLRRVYMCRASRGMELLDSARAEWQQALHSANNQRQSLGMLLLLTSQWHWSSEHEELLWLIVNHYPQEKWATQELSQALFAAGQTRSLMQLWKLELERTPANLVAKNNLAMMALLLDAKELKPLDLAREVYARASTNSSFATTYAFSLYTEKKSVEALKIMQGIKPQDLDNPIRAGYYGLILKATGSFEKAKVYLDLTSKAALLPEERALFDHAKNGS
jgi:cytochrome c-type biogenesis protein CcmH/NrfG